MVRFVKVMGYFNVVGRILGFVGRRLRETIVVGGVGVVMVVGMGFYLYVRMGKQVGFVECFFYAFLGIIGGDF